MISGKRQGPFSSYVRITYKKGSEEKTSTITTWGIYEREPYITTFIPKEQVDTLVYTKPVSKPLESKKTPLSQEEKNPPKEKMTSPDTIASVKPAVVSEKKEHYIFVISGNESITTDCYLVYNKKIIKPTLSPYNIYCFQLKAKPDDVWPIKIVTKKNGIYHTNLFFSRIPLDGNTFTIRVPNAGEKYRYTGNYIMINKQLKRYYFIKTDVKNCGAIQELMKNSHSLSIENRCDAISLPNDTVAAQYEKMLLSKGIKAKLETATEWKGHMWEMKDGKVVCVAKAYIMFNAGVKDQWIVNRLKQFGNVEYFNNGFSDSDKKRYGACSIYCITVNTCLYNEYMKVFDRLWQMKEVKNIEQVTVEDAD